MDSTSDSQRSLPAATGGTAVPSASHTETWGASAAIFGAGALLWPAIFFLAFFARAAIQAPHHSWIPHYSAAWEETIDVVSISGTYVNWVAPTLLAVLAGLGFLVTPTSDAESLSVLRPLPMVAALIGGFMLSWTVLGVIVLSVDPVTADSDEGRQLWGLVFLTPISIVLALVLGRLDFRPAARRIEQLKASIARAEIELGVLRSSERLLGKSATTRGVSLPRPRSRTPWRRPLVIQGVVTAITFFVLFLVHREPLEASILAAVYVTALGALVFILVALVQRWLVDAYIAKITRHERQSHLETASATILAVGVGSLVVFNLWFVFAGLTPAFSPILYGVLFVISMWIANPLKLSHSAWPAQVLRERVRALARMRHHLSQLEAVTIS